MEGSDAESLELSKKRKSSKTGPVTSSGCDAKTKRSKSANNTPTKRNNSNPADSTSSGKNCSSASAAKHVSATIKSNAALSSLSNLFASKTFKAANFKIPKKTTSAPDVISNETDRSDILRSLLGSPPNPSTGASSMLVQFADEVVKSCHQTSNRPPPPKSSSWSANSAAHPVAGISTNFGHSTRTSTVESISAECRSIKSEPSGQSDDWTDDWSLEPKAEIPPDGSSKNSCLAGNRGNAVAFSSPLKNRCSTANQDDAWTDDWSRPATPPDWRKTPMRQPATCALQTYPKSRNYVPPDKTLDATNAAEEEGNRRSRKQKSPRSSRNMRQPSELAHEIGSFTNIYPTDGRPGSSDARPTQL